MIGLVGHASLLDGVALVDAASSSNLQYREYASPGEIESQRSWRNRLSTTTNMDHVMTHNDNHLFEGNHMAQSFQQQAMIDECTLIWNESSFHPYVLGSGAGGPRETGHRSSTTFLHYTPHNIQHHNHHYPSSVIQGPTDRIHNPNMHQVPGSQNTMNPFHAGLETQPRHLLSMLPHRPRIYHSRQEGHVLEASRRHGNPTRHIFQRHDNLTRQRFLPPEEVAVLELSGDMHLGVEDASYEELLALGEQIGNVNTGLSEKIITSKLKTRKYVLSATNIHLKESAAPGQESDVCCICQEEYKNQENIGILSCRHEYHADCLKNWLLLKNECPICRSRGLTLD
ncbi:hypothetical protein SLA2020_231320 [Shorea laevis]